MVCGKFTPMRETHFLAITMRKCGLKPTLLRGFRPPATEERATVLSIGTTRVFSKLDLLDRLSHKCKLKVKGFLWWLKREVGRNETHFSGAIITSHTRMDHQGNEWGKINYRELSGLHGFPHVVIPNSTLYKV